MADFLSSFGLGADNSAPVASGHCNSVDELALHLRDALFPANKTSETKVEHVAVTLELRNTVQFHLSLSESENEALEGLNNVDPSLGGVRSASLSVDPVGGQGQATRVVAANETLMKQSDNPVLQRTVAKHILGAVSAVDGSNWTIRDLSRGQQGWTFTYICRDSLQHWTRHNAKNPNKAIICEYSQREPDPNLMSANAHTPMVHSLGSVYVY
jgi:ATP-dependent DNA helicase 2 subunit 1